MSIEFERCIKTMIGNTYYKEWQGLFGIPDYVCFSKNNGEISIISFELKLTNWRGALTQAFRYRSFSDYSYVIDAVDTVSAKIELVLEAQKANVPIIRSIGAGNKVDPTAFEIADIYQTSICPLARVMRRELRKRNVKHLKVVYSKEKNESFTGSIPSMVFVPATSGLLCANYIIRQIINK